ILEHSPVPQVVGPPKAREGRSGAAPGKLTTPSFELVQAEMSRALAFFPQGFQQAPFELIQGGNGATIAPGSGQAISAFLKSLGVPPLAASQRNKTRISSGQPFDPADRQRRQVQQMADHTQGLMRLSERVRDEAVWSKLKTASTNGWASATSDFKKSFWDDVIGRFPEANVPSNPRSRKILD